MYHEVNELFELNQQQYFTYIKKVGVHPSGFGAFKLTYTLVQTVITNFSNEGGY